MSEEFRRRSFQPPLSAYLVAGILGATVFSDLYFHYWSGCNPAPCYDIRCSVLMYFEGGRFSLALFALTTVTIVFLVRRSRRDVLIAIVGILLTIGLQLVWPGFSPSQTSPEAYSDCR